MFRFWKTSQLNPGGIFGAILFAAAAIAIIIYLMAQNGQVARHIYKAVLFAAMAGGFLGNWLWRAAIGRDQWEPPERFEIHDDRKT